MNLLVAALIAVFVLWMLACAAAGFLARLKLFALALLAGLTLNMAWMMLGLGARPLEANALIAQASLTLYGLCAFALGWFFGRLARRLRQTHVDSGGVSD